MRHSDGLGYVYIKIVPRLLVQYEKLLGTIRDVYLQFLFWPMCFLHWWWNGFEIGGIFGLAVTIRVAAMPIFNRSCFFASLDDNVLFHVVVTAIRAVLALFTFTHGFR